HLPCVCVVFHRPVGGDRLVAKSRSLTRTRTDRATIDSDVIDERIGGTMADLSPDERAELLRLRQRHGPGRPLRGVGASALLVVAALLAGLAVVAVYLRSEVLDTETFVQTVAPLDNDPVVRNAIAQRVTNEIIIRSDIKGLATDLATRLEGVGAPPR